MIRKHAIVVAALVVAASTLTVVTGAQAAPAPYGYQRIHRWWQYDTDTWSHSWRNHPKLDNRYEKWREDHPDATKAERKAQVNTHRDHHMDMHFHRQISSQRGTASWYNDQHGACGKPLKGYYAASRTLPCGSVVSVRAGGRYVFVTILDRGPFTGNNRILDLSKTAFRQLAPIGSGVIHITATRVAD